MINFKKIIFISFIFFFLLIPKSSAKYLFENDITFEFEFEDIITLEDITDSETLETLTIEDDMDLVILKNLQNTGKVDFEGVDIFLTEDLDLSGIASWKGIGTELYPFKGNFYGSDYTISNLTIDTTSDFQGFFGVNEGTISNLTVIGQIEANNCECIGGLVGKNLRYNFKLCF